MSSPKLRYVLSERPMGHFHRGVAFGACSEPVVEVAAPRNAMRRRRTPPDARGLACGRRDCARSSPVSPGRERRRCLLVPRRWSSAARCRRTGTCRRDRQFLKAPCAWHHGGHDRRAGQACGTDCGGGSIQCLRAVRGDEDGLDFFDVEYPKIPLPLRRLGERFRDRLTISSWSWTSTD
jgi:hypothetical protein